MLTEIQQLREPSVSYHVTFVMTTGGKHTRKPNCQDIPERNKIPSNPLDLTMRDSLQTTVSSFRFYKHLNKRRMMKVGPKLN